MTATATSLLPSHLLSPWLTPAEQATVCERVASAIQEAAAAARRQALADAVRTVDGVRVGAWCDVEHSRKVKEAIRGMR